MKEEQKPLPASYKAYEKLKICSNELINTKFFLEMENFIPLLIGRGKTPVIWLYALVDYNEKGKKSKWKLIIKENVSMHENIAVVSYNNQVIINMGSVTIIKAENTQDYGIVSKLDLRPLGLDIYGDDTVLVASNMRLSNNSVHNSGVFLGFEG